MTLICSKDDVTKLISEMRHWGDDPDLERIADALPLRIIELAYVKKLDALPPELPGDASLPGRATTARAKLSIMRRIYVAWFRAPHERLGQLLSNAVFQSHSRSEIFWVEDTELASVTEKRYPPRT